MQQKNKLKTNERIRRNEYMQKELRFDFGDNFFLHQKIETYYERQYNLNKYIEN